MALENLEQGIDCRCSETKRGCAGCDTFAESQVVWVAQSDYDDSGCLLPQQFDGSDLLFEDMPIVGEKADFAVLANFKLLLNGGHDF